MATRKLNKPLLRRLARKLRRLRHEEHYDQCDWFNKTECGTTACIAGHALIERGWKPETDSCGCCIVLVHPRSGARNIAEAARQLLGLPTYDLFHLDLWPDEYRERFGAAKQLGPAKQRPSRVAADLLDALADGTVEPF